MTKATMTKDLAGANAQALADVDAARASAPDALSAYWAGSASACYMARVKRGAVKTVDLRKLWKGGK